MRDFVRGGKNGGHVLTDQRMAVGRRYHQPSFFLVLSHPHYFSSTVEHRTHSYMWEGGIVLSCHENYIDPLSHTHTLQHIRTHSLVLSFPSLLLTFGKINVYAIEQ